MIICSLMFLCRTRDKGLAAITATAPASDAFGQRSHEQNYTFYVGQVVGDDSAVCCSRHHSSYDSRALLHSGEVRILRTEKGSN